MQYIPDFTLNDQFGRPHSPRDYHGKWIVIYFYPKDDTPGCTKEACAFRDGREMLQNLGAEIIGISKDTARSHATFANKHSLNFTLLSDPTTEVIRAFGSWNLKKFMGREFMGITRDTYLVNPEGLIVKKYENVDPTQHVAVIMKDLQRLV